MKKMSIFWLALLRKCRPQKVIYFGGLGVGGQCPKTPKFLVENMVWRYHNFRYGPYSTFWPTYPKILSPKSRGWLCG